MGFGTFWTAFGTKREVNFEGELNKVGIFLKNGN